MKTVDKRITLVLIGIFIFSIFFSTIVQFLSNYMWFIDVGYKDIYIKRVFYRFFIGIFIFGLFNFIMYFYFTSIKKKYYKSINILYSKEEEKKSRLKILTISSLISLLFSVSVSSSMWMDILKFKNFTLFGLTDPIFNKDISFYVFKLPVIKDIVNIISFSLILLMVFTLIYYIILTSNKEILRFSRSEWIHFDIKKIYNSAFDSIVYIICLFFVVLAIQNYLSSFDILYSKRGIVTGASFTDVNVTLFAYKIKSIISLFTAVLIILGRKKRNIKLIAIGPILIVFVGVASLIAENIVQNLIVSPNEIAKESKYIKYNMDYTKKAYGLGNIKQEEFLALDNLSFEDIQNNKETISNIPINDYRPTLQTYNQLQGIRSYYRFNDIDIDRYIIDGKLTQVFLSAREIDKSKLPSQAQTWINKHLKYTHGYGIVMSPVNDITSSGQPKTIIRNIPPVSEFKQLAVKRPEIYFGELTNDYIVINTKEDEFSYPKGETNAFTRYEGTAGIKLNLLNRILYSIDTKSLKLLVSTAINSDSRIIINRNINDRIKAIAPFIEYDEDPYIVLVDGKLYWIVDGYTTTERYPYSQVYEDSNINYIRNSVKVVIDAYNGDVDFYIVDDNDPIIKTYSKIFKDLFKSIDKMPQGIKRHLRYPQHIFDIQAKVYATYHMKDVGVFYNKEDQWEIATEIYQGKNDPIEVESNYIVFKLPNEDRAEFLLTVPYTPRGKQNMTALLVARNDLEKYGQIILYKFPKDKNVLGPYQIESRINQDPEISRNLTQWDSGGSKVIRGHMITVPIQDSLLYVEPLYIKSDSKESIPEVKKIIMLYKDKIVIENSLQEALDSLFKNGEKQKDKEFVYDQDNLITKANEIYNKAQQAMKEGNFSDYGKYIQELGEVLRKLESENR
ncbi:hypothetical protein SAMN05661008_01815 [Alkalithermobacter thermoalcaliphilus JW-YL-7 = DSM 7308]|uniref:UPF0182 protein JWYL7_1854 n=1 Tax=Alkalithermobacter thermoalcaliphilus JW-YL-7 = DSM 7308 TaxID=1121328 RepID=A0A150FT44_CLOPD|nr:UPF0182 protein [[Clostridium] paradoxum JW-YL-7 = DSM 7308]SHL28667.1 hypothetical protein SAMN05661008_01815 [[Clostridium] paradoxum JW-YL-7 = DSM 7308]